MDFGNPKNKEQLDELDLRLPPEPEENLQLLKRESGKDPQELFIGCPVWGEKEWVGQIYPKGAKAGDYLYYYSRQFRSIELNMTFYRAPTADMVDKWKASVPDNFRFCPKLPQNISHFGQLKEETYESTAAFCDTIMMLGDKLGMAFLQLPQFFDTRRFDALMRYLHDFPQGVPLAVEFRHPSWFQQPEIFNEAALAMENLGMSTVITDVACRRDALHMRLSGNTAFIRFNAYDLHPTDYPRIDEWVYTIKEWLENGLQTLYFFMHTHKKSLNPQLANYLIAQLNQHCGLQLEHCKMLDKEKGLDLFS